MTARSWRSGRYAALLIFGTNGPLSPVGAIQSTDVADPAAEQCIVYRDNGAGGYRLNNQCDYRISVAWCIEATDGSNGCNLPERWQNATLERQAELPGDYSGLQVISLFACRTPAVVKFETPAMGRCVGGAAVIPLLPVASLKNPSAIITASDYPHGVSHEGTTRFELQVDATGRPAACAITISAGHEALDKATCTAFMRRARFTPAKDSAGLTVAGRYRGSVTWKAP
jgi:TonB family protein